MNSNSAILWRESSCPTTYLCSFVYVYRWWQTCDLQFVFSFYSDHVVQQYRSNVICVCVIFSLFGWYYCCSIEIKGRRCCVVWQSCWRRYRYWHAYSRYLYVISNPRNISVERCYSPATKCLWQVRMPRNRSNFLRSGSGGTWCLYTYFVLKMMIASVEPLSSCNRKANRTARSYKKNIHQSMNLSTARLEKTTLSTTSRSLRYAPWVSGGFLRLKWNGPTSLYTPLYISRTHNSG